MTCPDCGEEAKFVSYRLCQIKTLMGDALYERAYYHCPHCQHGHCPTDADSVWKTSTHRGPKR